MRLHALSLAYDLEIRAVDSDFVSRTQLLSPLQTNCSSNKSLCAGNHLFGLSAGGANTGQALKTRRAGYIRW